jgi:tight adherence protein C
MNLLLVTSLLVFAAVTAAAYALSVRLEADRNPVSLRLRHLRALHSSEAGVSFGERPPALLRLVALLGGFLPAREGRDALRSGLMRAGYRRADAVLVLLGSKLLLTVLLPLAGLSIGIAAGRPLGNVLLVTVMLAVLGFYLPTIYVALRQRQRHDEILYSLPDSLDLMVVCVEAGLGMGAALQRVAVEMRLASPQLSEELSLVNREMQTGISRTDALRNLAQRTGVDDVYSLVAMLIQTDRLGTSVADALRTHAESMRTRRRQRAEQLARQASVKLAFPLVLLIFPALLVILLGPSGIQLMKALSSH